MRKITLLHIIIALIIIIAAILGYWSTQSGQLSIPMLTKQNTGYRAIFLTNGQVYFGKVTNFYSRYVKLADIYYLQVQQIQPKPEEKPGQDNDQQPKLSLIKLGNEIHSPEDSMNINRDQILFWEDLKESGQVVQAIVKDKESKK